jgi:AcrR family transcriptional regulator
MPFATWTKAWGVFTAPHTMSAGASSSVLIEMVLMGVSMRVLLVFDNSHSATGVEPRKRPRQARSRALYARILDEAARIFDAFGYHATTTNDIADAAGVSVGSLYQYFPNKDAVLVALAERHLDEVRPLLEELSRALRSELPDARALSRAIVDAGMAWNATDRLHQLLWRAPRSKALVERLGEIDDQMITDLEWHLVRFGHDPEVARLRAQLVVTTIEAVVHSEPVQGDRTRQAAELVDLCAAYIEAR